MWGCICAYYKCHFTSLERCVQCFRHTGKIRWMSFDVLVIILWHSCIPYLILSSFVVHPTVAAASKRRRYPTRCDCWGTCHMDVHWTSSDLISSIIQLMRRLVCGGASPSLDRFFHRTLTSPGVCDVHVNEIGMKISVYFYFYLWPLDLIMIILWRHTDVLCLAGETTSQAHGWLSQYNH